MRTVAGTFTATGAGDSIDVGKWNGNFNVSLAGFGVGTVELQRSFDRHSAASDAAATWETVTDGSFTADMSKTGYEPEDRVYYRFNCTAYTSGTITYRIGVAEREVHC